ncbi:2-dehydropantoate 2-reductase [Ottowia sp. VDI28]|uniref:2-dehydropantoate 2-reductase n=1 Tax=Ottowia sp. VDI28 TaxID=3133968 RepID=UPI003C2EE4B1
MGAGAIGCFVGGCLAAAGADVVFIARPRVNQALAREGLTLTDVFGRRHQLSPAALHLVESVEILRATMPAPSLVLLTVKSGATAEAASALAQVLPAGAPVLSLQNGLANAPQAQAAAPALRVLPGMVSFNVAELAPGHYHQGTEGHLAAQDDAVLRAWQPLFTRAGLLLELHADLRPVQWGKLLLNLNNPVNALSGLPLRAELMQRGYRQVFASLMDEALAVLRAAGIQPARLTPVPPHRLPAILRLPDWLFRVLAARMLRIDAQARSSMADDLAMGRRTEVDALCGEVVRLAKSTGVPAPRNARMVELIDGSWPTAPEHMEASRLLHALGLK